MRFAINIPQYVDDGAFDPDAFRAHMAQAEALGFESAWVQEQVLGLMRHVAPLELMTYAAACTERIRLGCSVFVLPLYSPVHLAKDLSSLDQLSRGRLEVGVGTGGKFRMFSAFGVDPDTFVARFVESLQLMKALWTEPKVDFEGRFFHLRGAAMEPKPFQKPYPPIWFGGNHPAAVRRAVVHGDGFFGAGSQTTAQFAEQVGVVRAALEAAGRDPSTFPIAKRVYIAVDDDRERAHERLGAALQELYSFFRLPDLTPVAVYGPPDACVEGLHAVAAAGAERILLNPLYDDTSQMERLAAEVVPHVSPN
ncbi:MAG TPA: LLM class flavin-dependent oxidoreductase [Acidimicrobiales bacterium]|nr:LLM class flavin-dependent oxidoreductase [Acidimicrobiales bacterium]